MLGLLAAIAVNRLVAAADGMSFAEGPRFFDDESPAFKALEEFLRANLSDKETLDDALSI